MSGKPKSFGERLQAIWERFRANFRRSLKGPLITKPHLEMSEKQCPDETARQTNEPS